MSATRLFPVFPLSSFNPAFACKRPARGAVLLIVLWMVLLLGIIGMSYAFSVRTQVQASVAARGRIEALWAARAGIELARAELMAADLATLVEGGMLLSDPERFANIPVGQAFFSLLLPQMAVDGLPGNGIMDEASRLNINDADEAMLKALPNITPDLVDTLLDWRDDDDQPRLLGAELEHYQLLPVPYFARNGKLASVRELLRIKGWEPLFRMVEPDPYSIYTTPTDESFMAPLEETLMTPDQARLLLPLLTVWSTDVTDAPDGEARLPLASASEGQMRNRAGLTRDEAAAIIAYRGNNKMESVIALLDVTRPDPNAGNNNSGGGSQSGVRGGSGGGSQSGVRGGSGGSSQSGGGRGGNTNSSGTKMFTRQRVGEFIDYFTTDASAQGRSLSAGAPEVPGRININTAPYDVLMTLPGITTTIVADIQNERLGGAIDRPGTIASLPGMSDSAFRTIYPWITGRSTRFHVWSRGWEPDSGAMAHVEATLAVTDSDVTILYWREY
jgi:DNA uptake protein ComE-like DNA-binding protein